MRNSRIVRIVMAAAMSLVVILALFAGSGASPAKAGGVRPAYNVDAHKIIRSNTGHGESMRIAVLDIPWMTDPAWKKLKVLLLPDEEPALWVNSTVWEWQGNELVEVMPFFNQNMMIAGQPGIRATSMAELMRLGLIDPYAMGVDNPAGPWTTPPWNRPHH